MLKRVIAGILGVPLLLFVFHEAYLYSFGFYEEHWTIPIEKIGIRMLRWQHIVFTVVAWSVLLLLFYVSYRLVKYAFRIELDVKWRTVTIVAALACLTGLGWFELKRGWPLCARNAPAHEQACAQFCAPSRSKSIALGSIRAGSQSTILGRKTSTITNHRSQWERQTPQLLTEGLLVRI